MWGSLNNFPVGEKGRWVYSVKGEVGEQEVGYRCQLIFENSLSLPAGRAANLSEL